MRFVFILATALLCSDPSAASSTDEEFTELAEQFVNDFSRFSPVSTTMIGDLSADHELDQVTAPTLFIRFLPSFCFLRTFILRVMSPP